MKRQKKRCAQCGDVMPPARTDAKYCSDACGVAYRRAIRKEDDPERRAAVAEVRRLVKAGELPEDYSTALAELQELRREVLDLPARINLLIETVCLTATVHHSHRGEEQADYVAGQLLELGRIIGASVALLGRSSREAAERAGEAYLDAQLGDELNAALYPAQVDHWWAEGPDSDGEGDMLI